MLAHHRVERLLSRVEVQVFYRPWFTGVHLPDYESAKVKYVVEDVIRHARAYGLALQPGAYVDLAAACRVFLLARGRGVGRPFNEGVHSARWLEGLDISQPDVLRRIASQAGLSASAVEEALAGGPWTLALEGEMADGQSAGVFGVPFFEFEEQKFWGNDRLDWLLAAVNGEVTPR